MSSKNYYTVPSNQIVDSIRNNKYYNESVKDGMIKLYTISPKVQNETYMAVNSALKFCKDYPEANYKISKLIVYALHEMYDLEKDKEDANGIIEELLEDTIDDNSIISDMKECYIIDVIIDIDGTMSEFPDVDHFNYRSAKIVYNDNTRNDWSISFAFPD